MQAHSRTWHGISSAPKDGTLIRLRNPKYGQVPYVMEWKNGRWAGVHFAPMGSRVVWWDEKAEQPTEWQEIVDSSV